MRDGFLLYPSARERLESAGLAQRVRALRDSDELPFIGGNTWQDEVVGFVDRLAGQGYYHALGDRASDYAVTLRAMARNPERFTWGIVRRSGSIASPCALSDVTLFSGDIAEPVLTAEELAKYSEFGFSTPPTLLVALSAYMVETSQGFSYDDHGYAWGRTLPDGVEIRTQITGDMNSDLRILQRDVTPYPTTDPFGNSAEFRPTTREDTRMVAAYHSTEGQLLVAALRYIDQQQIPVSFAKDGAAELRSWGNSLGQGGGTCAEHFGGFDLDSRMFFVSYDTPLLSIERAAVDLHTQYIVNTQFGAPYVALVDGGDLVLHQTDEQRKLINGTLAVRFGTEDAEHLVRGLIVQAARGLGRTSAKQLLDILAYRYADGFAKREFP